MKIKLYTLVDVTETNIRKGPDKIAVGQQSNYDTLIQVIGLRANPEPLDIISHNGSISKLGFGSAYKGTHNYWEFVFEMPEGSTDIDALTSDFDLVPIIADLTETAKLNINIFKTTDTKERNIVFNCVDNI